MPLDQFKNSMLSFTERIKQALCLEVDEDRIIHHRKNVMSWIQDQMVFLKDRKEEEKKKETLFTGILNLAGMNDSMNKLQDQEIALERIKQIMKGSFISFEESEVDLLDLPKDILQSLKIINRRDIPTYYGTVKGPLLQDYFIKTKEDFDNCIKKIRVNDLNFISLGSELSSNIIKYQRNLLEQLFNNLFSKQYQLSMVIKLSIEKQNFERCTEIYCFVEDISYQKELLYKGLDQIQIEERSQNLYINHEGENIYIDEMSVINCLLNQMIVVPIQSIVPDYAVKIEGKCAKIVKVNKSQIHNGLSLYIKQHPSLRNPLFYFSNYIKAHQFSTQSVKNILQYKQLYSNFYEILNILVYFMKNDFTIRTTNGKVPSLAVTSSVFSTIWKTFHQIVILSNWIQEIISPIKKNVTIFEINSKLCPIFNEILKLQRTSYSQYQKILLNLPIENYLTLNVSKISIERYKDKFLNINSMQGCNYQNIYQAVFEITIKDYNLYNNNIYEAMYFLNFIAENSWNVFGQGSTGVHSSWKSKRLWKEIYQTINKEFDNLHYISVNLDILAFYLNYDPIKNSIRPFEAIKNDKENADLFVKVDLLIQVLKLKHEKRLDQYLSVLLEKSFKYQKYKVVQLLIRKGARFNNYEEIFLPHPEQQGSISSGKQQQKTKSMIFMKNKQPEMFRRYQWEELINLKLKQKNERLVAFDTIRRGTLYIDKNIHSHLTSRNMMNNSLSRKDYMFSNNRLIGKMQIGGTQAYLEITQYPLLRYFYTFFLNKVSKTSLTLNYCGFFTKKGNLVHLIQSLPNCTNLKKGLTNTSDSALLQRFNNEDLSQAIIISMMLMPTNILLKNIFIPQLKAQDDLQGRNNLFIVDFHDFYQKNGFQSNAGDKILRVKNSLFIFDEMKNSISAKLLKKYSNMSILQIINSVFKECASLISEVNGMKPQVGELPEDQKQLFSIIFQNNFCESLVDRMFKIKRAFDKHLRAKSKVTHLQILQILNPALAYYYEEIIKTTSKLVDREKLMMDESFRRSFIVKERLINFLPNSFQTEETRDAFPNHYKKFVFEGPTENLANLYQNIRKFDIYTKRITDLSEYSHDVIEYFIRNVDLSLYDLEQREQFIEKIQSYSSLYLNKENNSLPLSVMRFSNLELLKEKNINFNDERLKELIFQDTSCSQSQFNTLLRRYQGMRNITIRNVDGFEKIGDSLIAVSDTYDFKNLKYLSIIGCRELLNIDIKCEQLCQIVFRRNSLLSQIYIFSRQLKSMDCSECPRLRLENIGIYIIKRVNILLSQNSCEGQLSKFYDKNYSIYLTRILRYLFECFEQSNTYKVELIMTLIKLQLIDQKLVGFKHNQIYNKNLVHLIAKLGSDILDLVLSQIFDIFLRNDLVDVLNLDQLLKINVELLKAIENYLIKLTRTKRELKGSFNRIFNTLIFHQFTKDNDNYNQTLSFIKTLINLIDVDKIVRFYLTISKESLIYDYNELISLLNKKDGIEKLELVLQSSVITTEFMQYLFTLSNSKNRICRLEFLHCRLTVDSQIFMKALPFIKSLIFNDCNISSLDFIQNFSNLISLQINACQFQSQIFQIYQNISRVKSLLNLSLIGIRTKLKDNDLYIDKLFSNIIKLQKLQFFDFSDNNMNKWQIRYFSENIHKVKVYQLNLYNFYDSSLNQFIESFLYHEHIKIIGIQFKIKSIKLFQSFIFGLANNKSVKAINLKTDQSIQSAYFLKIKENSRIENIQSNHPIPNWLKNHIHSNISNKSVSIIEDDIFEPNMNSREKNEDYCRIGLSLDGGGARGLLLATNLDFITRKVGKPLHKIFDYMGGTSIGGVCALSSAGTLDGNTPICTTREMMDIFEVNGDKIFRKTQFGNITNIFQTKYDIKFYEDLLYGYFKESKLSDVLKETNVVINAVNRLTNQDVIFRSLNAIFDRNQDFYMRDVARATSAAPTYFPSAEIKNINANQQYSLIDGGVGLNNPSKLVIDDIIKLTQNEAHKKNYFLLSLGTGRLRKEVIPSNAGIKDIAPIIDSLTQSANYFIEKDLSQNYRGHYLRISPFIDLSRKDSELDNTTPQTYSAYKDFAIADAEQHYENTIAFGKFKNQSFIQWLQQNTDKKYET